MSVCWSVGRSVCRSVCLHLYLSVCMRIRLSFNIYIYLCGLSVYVDLRLSIWLRLSICIYLRLSTRVSIYLCLRLNYSARLPAAWGRHPASLSLSCEAAHWHQSFSNVGPFRWFAGTFRSSAGGLTFRWRPASAIYRCSGLATTILVGNPRQICWLAALRFRCPAGTLFPNPYSCRLSPKVTWVLRSYALWYILCLQWLIS